ncbi:MAG: hypothetical protein ACR2PS_17590, partial [Pseudomonadales bacterium]
MKAIKAIKVRLLAGAMIVFSAMLFGNAATADHHEGPTFAPVELYSCTFADGKGMADLDKVTAKWNAWMDEKGRNDYVAVTLTPQFNDPDLKFDAAWMGFWPDGKAMGKSLQEWVTEGGKLGAEFDKVMPCDVHQSFAAVTINAPTGPTPETAVVVFSNCSIAEGKKPAEAGAALRAWGEYLKSNGIDGPLWSMWPAHGGGDADFDFKLVAGYNDYQAFGAAFDQFGNGGGYKKAAEIFGGVTDCDVARVYDMRLRRAIT